MKKLISVVLIALNLLMFASCNNENKTVDTGKISIVTTIFPYYDFAKNIAGDKANITLLLSPGSEPHNYEPSPSDIVAIEHCDIFIYNGGESDEWVESVIDSTQNKNMKILKMMDYVPLLEEHSSEHNHDHSHEHEEEEIEHSHGHGYDEHIWTSIKNAKLICSKISKTLSAIDNVNSTYYSDKENKYLEKLDKLDRNFINAVNNGVRDVIVFGDRFPFLYFATDYNLHYEAAFPGCSSKTEPNISTVTHMIDYVRDSDIPVVFYLEFSNGKTAQLIAEDTGAQILQFSSCHNVTKEEFENSVSYISLMEQNLQALEEALS